MNEHELIIVGAGPAGLALAACLKSRNIEFRIVDKKGVAGGAYNVIYGDMQMASPARYLSLPGLSLRHEDEYIRVKDYLSYLKQYTRHFELLVEKAEVTNVSPIFKPEASGSKKFKITFQAAGVDDKNSISTKYVNVRRVVIATGMFDTPRYPKQIVDLLSNNAGPIIVHAHEWRGVEEWLGKSVLIVGSATSAVEIAESFADAGQIICVSSRRGRFNSLPQRLLGKDIHDFLVPLAKLPRWMLRHHCRHYYENETQPVSEPATHESLRKYMNKGLIRLTAEVDQCNGKRIMFKNGESGEFDMVLCATGYEFDYSYMHFGVSREQLLQGFERGESRDWPGLYIMGKACVFGRPSQFVWGIAHDASILADKIADAEKAAMQSL